MVVWGPKTVALLDIWSIQHMFSGIFFGYLVHRILHRNFSHFSYHGILLVLAYLWELFEVVVEKMLEGREFIFLLKELYTVECHLNRYIGDPLTFIIGALIFLLLKKIRWYSIFLCLGWFCFYYFHRLANPL